jgi:DNA repair protein RecN (Recombination protein N)
MLTYISVKNFAIIENIEVTFHPGMTVLTGETGAGKSLLIDAIGLLLGDRATSNVVRTGASKAEVEGIFHISSQTIQSILDDLDVPFDDGELFIKRQITPTNNNIIKVNNQTVSLRDLRLITSKLADIHTQLDTHRLINQETYIEIIDNFAIEETTALHEDYLQHRELYQQELKKYKRMLSSSEDIQERLDLMLFQKKELENYNLVLGEEEQLEQEVDTMENFDAIFQTLKEAKESVEQIDALGTIYQAQKRLKSIASLNPEYNTIQAQIESAYYELDDAFSSLTDQLSALDYNPTLLDQHQERLNELDVLKRKYRKTIPEIIDYLAIISEEIDNIDHNDERLKEQKNVVIKTFEQTKQKAQLLTKKRQETCRYIEQELLQVLQDLELPKTRFEITFNNRTPLDFEDSTFFQEHGVDDIDFMLSTNIGEPLKSLSKSASGGEMSRIMLGFKHLLASSLGLSLMIFDEIDTGVSGYVANQVAKKMLGISAFTQVIAITHIPQVAAKSTHHLRIHKEVVDERTIALIEELDGDNRVHEIAQMISGDAITDASIRSAKELLQQ